MSTYLGYHHQPPALSTQPSDDTDYVIVPSSPPLSTTLCGNYSDTCSTHLASLALVPHAFLRLLRVGTPHTSQY